MNDQTGTTETAAEAEPVEREVHDLGVDVRYLQQTGEMGRPIKAPRLGRYKQGSFVSVRPCDDRFGDKTYLGIYVGDVPVHGIPMTIRKLKPDSDQHVLVVEYDGGLFSRNPAILIPELGEIVYGYESWWGVIKTPDDLKKITDADIQGVWYVQALKTLLEKEAAEQAAKEG